jgi:hypothetical protein
MARRVRTTRLAAPQVTYAEKTTVSTESSRMEIERTLIRYGADGFAYGWDGDAARIQFRAHDRHVRFIVPLPDRNDPAFTHHSRGRRTADAAMREWEQASRQRWRALALVVKAKLEAVEAGITVFEDEFLAHIVLPDGQTVAEHIGPQIVEAYASGQMPKGIMLAIPERTS